MKRLRDIARNFFSLFATSGGGRPRRLAHEEGWIQAALAIASLGSAAVGAYQSYKDSRGQKQNSTSEPWGPAQEHLKYGLSESRRLYDERKRVPPPTRDLSHLFQTIPGIQMLKSAKIQMPNFVNNKTVARRDMPEPVDNVAWQEYKPRPGGPPQGMSSYGGVKSVAGLGFDDAMRQWEYDKDFEANELDDYLRRIQGGSGGGISSERYAF